MGREAQRWLALAKTLLPPLSTSLHKGQCGRVATVGGSEEYTGAPFFASLTPLMLGTDLSHVICHHTAAPVIKSYSPELIVHPAIGAGEEAFNKAGDLLSRIHVVIVGPGLGRDDTMQRAAAFLILQARARDIPIILDADAIWLVEDRSDLIYGNRKAVLTPNIVEFRRLCKSQDLDPEAAGVEETLSRRLGGVTIVRKGLSDIIVSESYRLECAVPEPSPRRFGGQGDILTGSIATFLAFHYGFSNGFWGHSSVPEAKSPDLWLAAIYAGCFLTKRAASRVFRERKRHGTVSHLLNVIPLVMQAELEDVDFEPSLCVVNV